MDIPAFEKSLRNHVEGELRFDPITRTVYSCDASIYEVKPLGIFLPKNEEDIVTALAIAKEHHIPVIPRGAATGITGGCLGKGLIIDLSQNLNKILNINLQQMTATCQVGVIQDALNSALSQRGLRLGPDTSTGNRATLGGMFANNAAGARSLRYGCMADHVVDCRMALIDAKIRNFSCITIEEWEEYSYNDELYRTAWEIRNTYSEEIRKGFPPIPRRVSGYNLLPLLSQEHFNFCKIIAGSEGTLGIVTQMTVKICEIPKNQILCLLPFEDMIAALEIVQELLTYDPLALEMIDRKIIEAGLLSPTLKNSMSWLPELTEALFILEFDGDEAQRKAQKIQQLYPACKLISNPEAMKKVWELRKAGLGLLMSKRTWARAIAFIEDVAVPPHALSYFMKDFLDLLKQHDKTAGIYGHVGAGCMHIRPYMDLRYSDEIALMKSLMKATTQLLLKHQGSLSGEHGDGLIRSWLTEELYGKELYSAFVKLKSTFDPYDIMNPHKIVHGLPVDRRLRKTPPKQEPFLDFTKEGGLDLAVDLCNGNGLCRKKDGTMCPSFQATANERDSTRARAIALRALMRGDKGVDKKGVFDVLDLCIECKGCKTECPSQVDMAKMKAEFLFQYNKHRRIPLRDKIFGNIGKIFALCSPISPFINFINRSWIGRLLTHLFGVTSLRPLPKLASCTFDQWVKKQPKQTGKRQVILFNDTFTNFNHPHIGIAAFILLQKLNFEVIVPPWKCCGRTAFSKGFLLSAKEKVTQSISQLDPTLPIIFLEPSCMSMFTDDFPQVHSCYSLEDFLLRYHLIDELNKLCAKSKSKDVYLHVHCHQKALEGISPAVTLLKSLSHISLKTIPSGCCGMAGAFGYEKEHYEISMKMGELVLFSTIRQIPEKSIVIANGSSCRSQIFHGTGRSALHLAELLVN